MNFFKISSIDNVDLSQSLLYKGKLTITNIKNIESIINFLKQKEINFKFLNFSFNNRDERDASSKLFFRNFLNFKALCYF